MALYLRVSTQEQQTEGYGLEAQEQYLRDYLARQYGAEIASAVLVYGEVHTGSQLKERPQLQRLLKDVKQGKIDKVLVYKIDRLSRNMKHLIEVVEVLNKHDVEFVSYTEDMNFGGFMGKFLLNMLGSIAELERGTICGRTYSGKVASARSGNFIGNWAPDGYKKIPSESGKGSQLEIIPSQAKWVKQMYRWSVYDNRSDDRIAQKLNKLGVPYDTTTNNHHSRKKAKARQAETCHDKQQVRKCVIKKSYPVWTDRIIERIMTNELFMGKHMACCKDEMGKLLPQEKWVIVDVPIIVEPLLWYRSQEARKRRKNFHGKDIYLLSKKIVDMDTPQRRWFCGVRRTKGGISYRRNQCRDVNGGYYPAFEVPAQVLEEYVWNLIVGALERPERFYNRYCERKQQQANTDDLYQEQATQLQKEILQIEAVEIPRIQTAFEEGIYDTDTTKKRLHAKREILEQKRMSFSTIESQRNQGNGLEKEYKKLKEFSQHVKECLSQYDREQKRVLCNLLVEKIELSRVLTSEKPKRWDISGKVVLRFGKPLYLHEECRVRTLIPSFHAPSRDLEGDFVVYGNEGVSTYKNQCHEVAESTLFEFPFTYRKTIAKSDKTDHRGKVVKSEITPLR